MLVPCGEEGLASVCQAPSVCSALFHSEEDQSLVKKFIVRWAKRPLSYLSLDLWSVNKSK